LKDAKEIMAAQPYGYSQIVTTPLNGKLIILFGMRAITFYIMQGM
jgi:hypothetical protein